MFNKKGLFYLFIVYLVWGSTYLAMRVGVREGSGFPVFWLGAERFIIASPFLFLIAKFSGKSLAVPKGSLLSLIFSGVGIWLFGHGLVLYAGKHIESGFSAVVVGSTPVWMTVIESSFRRKVPGIARMIFILVGFAGVGALVLPRLLAGSQYPAADAWAVACLVAGTFFWSYVTVFLKMKPIQMSAITMSAYHQLFGGIGFLITALLLGEPFPVAPKSEAVWAVVYLTVFGSIIAYTAFLKAVELLPTSIASTYAYVNPVIAVILGIMILDETISHYMVLGVIFIIISVYGIFRKSGN